MRKSDEILVQVGDVEDVRHVLAACQNYFQARDLMEAQVSYEAQRYSPLTNEIARVFGRFHGYLGDYLLAAHEAADDESVGDAESTASEEPLGSEEGAETLTADAGELSSTPFGPPKLPKQQGRRVKADRKPTLAETQGEEVAHTDE